MNNPQDSAKVSNFNDHIGGHISVPTQVLEALYTPLMLLESVSKNDKLYDIKIAGFNEAFRKITKSPMKIGDRLRNLGLPPNLVFFWLNTLEPCFERMTFKIFDYSFPQAATATTLGGKTWKMVAFSVVPSANMRNKCAAVIFAREMKPEDESVSEETLELAEAHGIDLDAAIRDLLNQTHLHAKPNPEPPG